MLARFLQRSGYATGHFGKWHMGGQRDVKDAPAITEYGFDQSLTNFEGMGPKLLPLTLKPGQDPKNPVVFGTMPNISVMDTNGCNVLKSLGDLWMLPCHLSIRPKRTENLLLKPLAGRCAQPLLATGG